MSLLTQAQCGCLPRHLKVCRFQTSGQLTWAFRRGGKGSQLNINACGGHYDKSDGQFGTNDTGDAAKAERKRLAAGFLRWH